jgi:hypothetical protein
MVPEAYQANELYAPERKKVEVLFAFVRVHQRFSRAPAAGLSSSAPEKGKPLIDANER